MDTTDAQTDAHRVALERAEFVSWQEGRAFEAGLNPREKMLRETLSKISGLAGSCVVQRVPSDDALIAEHIEEIRDMALAALKMTESAR